MFLTEYDEKKVLEMEREEGRQEGWEEGRQEGRQEGENNLSMVMARLFSQNRIDDAKRCSTDVEYRKKLYKEFQLI